MLTAWAQPSSGPLIVGDARTIWQRAELYGVKKSTLSKRLHARAALTSPVGKQSPKSTYDTVG